MNKKGLTFFNSKIVFALNLHRSQSDSLSKIDFWLSGILKVHTDDELTDKFMDINTRQHQIRNWSFLTILKKGDFLGFFQYFIQHCFFYRPTDFTVSKDAGIEPRTSALADKRPYYLARYHVVKSDL